MSSARARANHYLYLAKILLRAWRSAVTAGDIPVNTLAQAFLPATREHLCSAYGWFLLELTGSDPASGMPPRNCAALPGAPEGKAVSGEIRECQQLESRGWLGDLLAPPEDILPVARTRGNLAGAATSLPGIERAQEWIDQLEALFNRMSDSLDEY